MFKKIIAKKIIILSPISFSCIFFLQVFLRIPIKKIDILMQRWALTQADFFSREDWEDIQFIKLKSILTYAYKKVPFWTNLFIQSNFNPEKMNSIEDIQKIPITTRSELKKIKIEELLATNVPKSRLLKAFTSGSTGEPFGFYQDKEELFRRGINNFEEFRYAGFDLKKGKILIINLSSHKDLDSFGERVSIVDFENYEKRRNILYPKISILQPRLLISTPSHLERFLFFCEKDGFRPVIESVCYLGELMEEGLKKRIESFFGAVVYSTYGTRECSLIGIQCKSGLQHTAPWMNYVEVVNGQVIVTTFENKVMPFIRYSIGDEGVLLNETCKCGRSSQLIKFKGRAGGAIELSNKRLVPILYITQHIANKYSKKISKFQFQQDSYKQIQMRYVPNSKNESTAIEESLNIYLNSLFENQIEVVFHCVDYILPNDSGKTTLFIKNLK